MIDMTNEVKNKKFGITELFKMFPDDQTAEKWLEEQRWPNGKSCPECGSSNYYVAKNRKPMPYRCRDCRSYFSVLKGTVLQSSKIKTQKWVIGIFLLATNPKGISSTRVGKFLSVRQATAWFMMHRIRECFADDFNIKFSGPVEIDETYIGGKEKNKHSKKRIRNARGSVGKEIVIGVKDRKTNRIRTKIIENTKRGTLHDFVNENVTDDAIKYTDENPSYRGIKRHRTVNHSAGEYVIGATHTNGIESHWALFKRAYQGTYHKISPKHLHRYLNECAGRNNIREMDTVNKMSTMYKGMIKKRLRYNDLVTQNDHKPNHSRKRRKQ